MGTGNNLIVYQRAAYRLDSLGLAVKWGDLAAVPGTATVTPLGAGEACDGVTVVCYGHGELAGFSN